jgi:hypothetical protein
MSAFATLAPHHGIRTYTAQRRAFKWTLRASLPFFLTAIVLRRVARALAGRSSAAPESILAETRASAAAVIPFIFMG